MSYLTFKLISVAVLVVLLLVLIMRRNSKQEAKQADSSTAFQDKHRFNKETNETKVETPESVEKKNKPQLTRISLARNHE